MFHVPVPVLLLLIFCFVFIFVLVCISSFPFQLCNDLDEEERELVALLLLSFRCFVTVNVLCSSSQCHGLVCSL